MHLEQVGMTRTQSLSRRKLLPKIAKAIEFTYCFLMSVTDRGYQMRLEWAVAAIEALINDQIWEADTGPIEQEDARSIATLFRRMVRGR